ncbi:hypothetical protein O181_078714 [Austropuccinia psidii MF-1]|uniref:Uncharacterized protein n=1 Tax=Austropuccinia psidii MF-1 TaxID=1389203 RepID=A0A9Q3FHG3_9BASI|nr:hypothetical protein [Austropuccinia psidii MF-1]
MDPITAESFKLRPGEAGEVPQEFRKPERVRDFLEYLGEIAFFGHNFRDEEAIKNFNVGEFAHPIGQPYITKQNNKISQEDGVKAIFWAGRHVTSIIEKQFPVEKFEFVWNHSPKRFRSNRWPSHFK